MGYCGKCGNKLKDNYKFCPKCGSSLSSKKEDKLYDDVLNYVYKFDKISTSMIQKEFNISYQKASNIINLLYENGVVGPSNGNKGREVIKNKDEVLENEIGNRIKAVLDTPDTTSSYDTKDINDNVVLAMLSYISILVFIPYFFSNNSKYVKFHATQGMNLLIVWVGYSILYGLLGLIKVSKVVVDFGTMVGTKLVTPIWITLPMDIAGIILFLLSILGIVNAVLKKAKELPIIGKIKIVK